MTEESRLKEPSVHEKARRYTEMMKQFNSYEQLKNYLKARKVDEKR